MSAARPASAPESSAQGRPLTRGSIRVRSVDRELQRKGGGEREEAVERFAQRIRGERDERRVDRADAGCPHAGTRSGAVECDEADEPHRDGTDQRLNDLDACRRLGRHRASGVERREKQRIARCSAKPLRRPAIVRVVVDKSQTGGDAARERQILVLVVGERLVDPVEEAKGEPQREGSGRRHDDEAACPDVVESHRRPDTIAGSRSASPKSAPRRARRGTR